MNGGVLVLHPWWGLNDDVRSYAERLRGEGYQVATPDLYHGRVATTIDAAKALQQELTPPPSTGSTSRRDPSTTRPPADWRGKGPWPFSSATCAASMAGLREVIVATGLVALGALIAALAQFTISLGVQTDPLGPRAMPIALGVGMALCGLLLLAGRFVRSAPLPVLLAEGPGESEDAGPFSPSRLVAVIVATAVYVALFEPLGHLLATPLYVAALLLIHGATPRRALLAAPVIIAVTLYAGFRLGLNVPLPGGILETALLR